MIRHRFGVNIFYDCAVNLWVLLIPVVSYAQTATIGGTIKDSYTNLTVDSVQVDIVSVANPAERYSVFSTTAGMWSYTFQPSSVEEQHAAPRSLQLFQNYPNPFNPSTTIPFFIPRGGNVTITVHNILGQRIAERQYSLSAGNYSVRWNGGSAAGVYFYTISMEGM